METILIAGAGPAGAAAAIAARLEGAPVRLVDRSRGFRHKVCGEFLSPGTAGILESLGAWEGFRALAPHRMTRCVLHLGTRQKRWRLDEMAWGLSRMALDRLLAGRAAALGAEVARGEPAQGQARIVAWGRRAPATHPDRLFGFKAHHRGPCDDAVQLFFDGRSYAGVSGVEGGLTNVCALAPESLLRRYDFDFDAVVRRSPPLAERLAPLSRTMEWIVTGPLGFSFAPQGTTAVYAAGDALGFVDPFTGSGILNALLTGRLAGIAAARGTPVAAYEAECRRLLGRPFRIASALRRAIAVPALHTLARFVPGAALFRLTRAV